jgi:AMMECR1 domain-containing protein
VFLPQVAHEQGWTRETLLAEASLKAGLDADAWRDARTEISVFAAEILNDSELLDTED